MLRGTYVGVRGRLRHETALLQRRPGGYVAQFDDRTQREAFGWHWFPERDFAVETEV